MLREKRYVHLASLTCAGRSALMAHCARYLRYVTVHCCRFSVHIRRPKTGAQQFRDTRDPVQHKITGTNAASAILLTSRMQLPISTCGVLGRAGEPSEIP